MGQVKDSQNKIISPALPVECILKKIRKQLDCSLLPSLLPLIAYTHQGSKGVKNKPPEHLLQRWGKKRGERTKSRPSACASPTITEKDETCGNFEDTFHTTREHDEMFLGKILHTYMLCSGT